MCFFGAFGQGDNFMTREHLGLVGGFPAVSTQGLVTSVAIIHCIHILTILHTICYLSNLFGVQNRK